MKNKKKESVEVIDDGLKPEERKTYHTVEVIETPQQKEPEIIKVVVEDVEQKEPETVIVEEVIDKSEDKMQLKKLKVVEDNKR